MCVMWNWNVKNIYQQVHCLMVPRKLYKFCGYENKESLLKINLWRAGYAPAYRQTSWGVLHPFRPSTQLGVYSSTLVQSLYISCCLSDNKPVLSYLLSRLLPQWWPRSGCTLCIVHCTLTLTLTRRQSSALVALSSAFVSDFCFKFCSAHSIGYNFHSTFHLRFRLEIISFFPNSVFCWK